MSQDYRRPEEFEAEPPPAETIPLATLRRALMRMERLRSLDVEAAACAAANPADARLARCAAHLAGEVEAARVLAAGAVLAYTGHATGPSFVRDLEGVDHIVRVDPGEPPRLAFVEPGEADYPDPAEVFDLIGEEQRFIRRAVQAVIGPGRLLDLCLGAVEDFGERESSRPRTPWHWMFDRHTVASFASACVMIGGNRFDREVEEAGAAERHRGWLEAQRVARRAARLRGRYRRRRR